MVVVILIIVGLLGLAVVAMLALRRATQDEIRFEERLREPGHTVAYVLPAGQEPVVLEGALRRAGFASLAESEKGVEVLHVECVPEDRDEVRRIIASASRSTTGGATTPAGAITFQDEG
jgi:uncharacterized SAM-binding protein YcdF (DUF218 family)